jgi:hypothetical protein
MYMSPRNTLRAGRVVARFVKDVLLNEQELEGLMTGLLVSNQRARGTRRLENWLLASADTLGRQYSSELARHWR